MPNSQKAPSKTHTFKNYMVQNLLDSHECLVLIGQCIEVGVSTSCVVEKLIDLQDGLRTLGEELIKDGDQLDLEVDTYISLQLVDIMTEVDNTLERILPVGNIEA